MSEAGPADPRLLEPIRRLPIDPAESVENQTALCLSGGGYRAMLFHLGVLRRLNDAGYLPRVGRISSVSGGSITAAIVALAWDRLDFGSDGVARRFTDLVEDPLCRFAGETIDVTSVALGAAIPGQSIPDRVAKAYRKHLFGDATLQDLPSTPTFVINATNVGSGALVRFTRAYLADWRVGRIENSDLSLATAVACSSAFPPVLSPARIPLGEVEWLTDEGNDLTAPEHRDELVLTDGGVYDNLGLETAWKRCRTVIVSDGGGQMAADSDPPGDWARHMTRVLKLIDNQVRALRKRQVIEGFKRGDRQGVYVGIRSDVADYRLADSLPAPHERIRRLADLPTRLARVSPDDRRGLINWGYVICDAGLRRHVEPGSPPPAVPYPGAWAE
jgi:NTE family protein